MTTLRNAVIAFFLILAAVVVTKTGRDQTPSPDRPAASLVCDISPQRVTEGSGKLVSAVQYRCDSPGPEKLTITVRLQQSRGGSWHTAAQQQFSAAGAETLRSVPVAQRTRQVSAPCVAGAYRTEAEWTIGGRTRTKLSAERTNPCD
ncbi:hypothetical protein AB0M46_17065 [Dactylosporangium sp. NPDC051485]|uniref:hypothetical protein n=1 Tax=Dactylosporangium sp. NPDC051485 TaxID=3154846 RepID=UPI003434D7F0